MYEGSIKLWKTPTKVDFMPDTKGLPGVYDLTFVILRHNFTKTSLENQQNPRAKSILIPP